MSDTPFTFEAWEVESRLLHGFLDTISTEGLAGRLHVDGLISLPPPVRNELAGAIVDLSALIDEIRFSGAFAAVLIEDYERVNTTPEPGRQVEGQVGRDLRELGMPVAAMALLAPYFAPTPGPHALFTTPHIRFAGDRVLSLWFSGQLIDSGLVRVVAALDRLAIILWTSAGLQIPVSKRVKHPSFRKDLFKLLQGHYALSALDPVQSLTHHELFRLLMRVRNRFVHSSRILSELHGHYRVAYETVDPRGTISEAIDKRSHMAILLACYNEVLRPAVELSAACLTVGAAN